MLTQKQQQIVDSLVNEFAKMNAPKNGGKKGLLDWDEIYQERDEWEKTKQELAMKDRAFIANAHIEMKRITEMLEREFEDHFYIHQPENNNVNRGWTWYIVAYGSHWHESTLRIEMTYQKSCVNNPSKTHSVYKIDHLFFESSADKYVRYNSIEDLFTAKNTIQVFKRHLNK